jgi:flavodoxin
MIKPTLVVFFSRTGYTRRIADDIATAVGADVENLREPAARSGIFGYFRSAREALRATAVELLPATFDPRDYNQIVLGTPVWASHVCSPIRAYIATHKDALGRVAFFCTQGGSGADKVFGEMAELCGRAPVATVAVNDRDIGRGEYGANLRQFVAALGVRKAA